MPLSIYNDIILEKDKSGEPRKTNYSVFPQLFILFANTGTIICLESSCISAHVTFISTVFGIHNYTYFKPCIYTESVRADGAVRTL